MRDLNSGDLHICVESKNNIIIMKWLGKSRERDPGAMLYPYFNEVISEINEGDLVIDFHELEYMNSSTVPPILKLFKLLDTRKIKTKILYDSRSGWQCASFKALGTIAETLDYVEVEGLS
ncbi:MAG: hypothetical protein MUF15_26555 [Acidobacteria bacterium]|nr:hypothetical protein [Acidobacteriota bacterium]